MRGELFEEVGDGVALLVPDAEVDAVLQQCPDDLGLAAESSLV